MTMQGVRHEVLFREDIRNMLVAIARTAQRAGANGEYARGFRDALLAVSEALDIRCEPVLPVVLDVEARVCERRSL